MCCARRNSTGWSCFFIAGSKRLAHRLLTLPIFGSLVRRKDRSVPFRFDLQAGTCVHSCEKLRTQHVSQALMRMGLFSSIQVDGFGLNVECGTLVMSVGLVVLIQGALILML